MTLEDNQSLVIGKGVGAGKVNEEETVIMEANRLLVGTDFSEASVWAAQHAAEFAQKLEYEFNLVHVIDAAGEGDSFLPDYSETEEQLEEIGKRSKRPTRSR